MRKDTKDCDVKTMSVPAAGRLYLGLGRNGSYAAAKRGEIPVIKIGARLRAVGRWSGSSRRLDERAEHHKRTANPTRPVCREEVNWQT